MRKQLELQAYSHLDTMRLRNWNHVSNQDKLWRKGNLHEPHPFQIFIGLFKFGVRFKCFF